MRRYRSGACSAYGCSVDRRAFLAFMSAFAASEVLAGCSSSPASPNGAVALTAKYAAPLTLAAAPAYVASEKGLWSKYGLALEMRLFDSGRQALDALIGGQADFMSVSETPPMAAVAHGSEIFWIGTATRHAEAKFTYRTDRISDPSSLAARRIGSQPGTNSDYLLYRWLKQNSISTSALTIVSLKAPEMVQALIQGEVDGIFAWEPHNYKAYSRLRGAIANASGMPYRGYHCLIASPAMVKNESIPTTVAFLAGLRDAVSFMTSNPEESRAIVSKVTGMDLDTLAALWGEYTFVVEMPDDLTKMLEEQLQWLVESEGLSTRVQFSNYLSPTALRQVL